MICVWDQLFPPRKDKPKDEPVITPGRLFRTDTKHLLISLSDYEFELLRRAKRILRGKTNEQVFDLAFKAYIDERYSLISGSPITEHEGHGVVVLPPADFRREMLKTPGKHHFASKFGKSVLVTYLVRYYPIPIEELHK
jgi:hypothetical protein